MKHILRLTAIFTLLLFFGGNILGQVNENFDNWSDGSYTPTSTYTDANGGQWETYNAMCHSDNARSGNAIRFNDDSGENEYLLYKGTDGNGKDGGIGTISFWYRHWDGDGSGVQFQVQYNQNSGGWTNIGSVINVTSTTYTQFSETVNLSGDDILIQVISIDDAERLLIDDFSVTNYSSGATEPTNHPADFAASANSESAITLTWTDSDAASYLIKGSTVSYDDITDPVDGTAEADGGLVKNITSGTQTHQFTGLSANQQYFFEIFAYNGSDATVNYKVTGAPQETATTESVNDNDSEVKAPGEQLAARNISSTADDEMEEAVPVFKIVIKDKGSGDGLATIVKNIRLKPHTTNTADWTDNIQGLTAYDGSNYYSFNAEVTDSYIDLTFFDEEELSVGDGQTVELTLNLYLNSSDIVDGAVISFMVDADDHGFTADASGSGFASEFLLGDFHSNDITIDVTFDELRFTQQPTNVNLGDAISPSVTVALTDENGNVDTDADGTDYTIGLTTTGSFDAMATTSIDAVSGVATFNNLVFSAQGSGVTITTIDPDSWGWTNITSDAFDVSELPNLIISEVADPGDVYQTRFIEIYNTGSSTIDFSTTTIYISRQTNGGNWEDKQLTGSIAPNQTYVAANSNDDASDYFYVNFGFMADYDYGGSSGNGDDGYFLYYNGDHNTGTLLDAFGVIDEDGSGKAWEYEDKRAVRNSNITTPNTIWTESEWTIVAADVANCTPGEHNDYVFVNATGNWNSTSTWSNGKVPTSTKNVIVAGNTQLTIASAKATGTCNNITLENGATLLGQENLTINGTATVEGSYSGNSGTAGAKDAYYVISSPLSAMDIAGSDFEPVGNEDDFFVYDQGTNYWMNYFAAGNPATLFDQFDAGTGYLVSYAAANAGTKAFESTGFNAASVSPSISNSNSAWNLIGNPYPSKVTWADVSKSLVSSPKTLNATSGAWEDMGTEIETGQGIFVYAEDGSPSLTFETADQTHGSGGKKDAVNYAFMNLHFGEHTIYTRFAVNENASQNYEWQHDSRYMHPISQIPFFSAITQDEVKVSTYVCETEAEEDFIVPLYFSVPADQEISFDFDGNLGYEIVLEDQNNNEMTELTNGVSYTFTASTSDAPDRFLLHFKATTAVEDMETLDASIYTYDNKIYISGLEEVNNAAVELFTVDGRRILAEQFAGAPVVQVGQKLPLGCYIVRLTSENQTMTKKIVLN